MAQTSWKRGPHPGKLTGTGTQGGRDTHKVATGVCGAYMSRLGRTVCYLFNAPHCLYVRLKATN